MPPRGWKDDESRWRVSDSSPRNDCTDVSSRFRSVWTVTRCMLLWSLVSIITPTANGQRNEVSSEPTVSPTRIPVVTPETTFEPTVATTPLIRDTNTLFPTPDPTNSNTLWNDTSSGTTSHPTSTIVSSSSPVPTATPSLSVRPSSNPTTAYPTFVTLSMDKAFFRQDFIMLNATFGFFNDTEQLTLVDVFNGYTALFASEPNRTDRINTECLFDDQRISTDDFNRTINTVDYSCQYSSRSVNVTGYPVLFYTFVKENLSELTEDAQAAGLAIVTALELELEQQRILSPAPSISSPPSTVPTVAPTVSVRPSIRPSRDPSVSPTVLPLPTTPPIFLLLPTTGPTVAVLDPEKRLAVGAIATLVILVGVIFLTLLWLYYRQWSHKRETELDGGGGRRRPSNDVSTSGGASANTIFTPRLRGNRPTTGRKASSTDSLSLAGTTSVVPVNPTSDSDDNRGGNTLISPTDSLLSNKSLLSIGDSGMADGSGDENDGTKNLQDEFDQYKDKNLEQLRADVEGNLSGFEGIMSAVVTNALIGDEEANVETLDLLWGCSENPHGTEIEASALFEVCDWLKRNESSGDERKRAFMQDILHKMVASVRHGVIVAENASRTIHESAAILGLQLAEELPTTTVIISGMRKMTTADDMTRALDEFGDIDEAAVASGKRGFGIVRFRRRKSVDQALQRYKSGEIVILDVSIQMKVILPSGVIESR